MSAMLIRPLILAAAIALPLTLAASDAGAAPVADGDYKGVSIADDQNGCRNRSEWPLDVSIRNGNAIFKFGRQIEADGKLDDRNRVKAYGRTGRGHTIVLEGQFVGLVFTGTFYIGNGQCAGDMQAKVDGFTPAPRPGAASPSVDMAKIEAELEAEAKAKEMAAQIERLKAEQEALRKQNELAELRARNTRSAAPASGGNSDLKRELATLQQLKNDGLITDAQFKAKQQLLIDQAFGTKPQTRVADAEPKLPPKRKLNVPADINFGNYHALVIGINNYKHLTKLRTAVADAEAMAKVLQTKYSFQVTKLINPSRSDIIDTLDDLRGKLKFKDNLLIYYAGHGWLDEKADQGFWLPADAKPNRRSN